MLEYNGPAKVKSRLNKRMREFRYLREQRQKKVSCVRWGWGSGIVPELYDSVIHIGDKWYDV